MNNKAQFTPGPWDCDNDWAVGKRAINGSLDLIANLSYSCFQDAKQADANLIAAAPAMYEALREIVAAVGSGEVIDYSSAGDWYTDACTVLAQAEGRND